MSEAGDGSRPNADGPAPRASADPGGSTAPQGAGQGPRPPSWRALITGLMIALVMTTIMITTYVSAQHSVVARDLPWGATGTSPLTTAVQQHISLDIHHYSDQIGPGLPPWNASTLIRNTLYFGGNSITQPLVVLSIYTVLGAALVIILTYGRLLWWRGAKRRRSPISAEEEGVIATIPPA
ncbi:hypothetical protein AB0945_34785 [Streptomyces sp. NPDC005474]|uniref:hypothetical protein n=1 Tax=Streptomyces sp. NPDC005474 TaxID=3154878 RepID=UPI003453757B